MRKMANIALGRDTGLPCFGSYFGEYGLNQICVKTVKSASY